MIGKKRILDVQRVAELGSAMIWLATRNLPLWGYLHGLRCRVVQTRGGVALIRWPMGNDTASLPGRLPTVIRFWCRKTLVLDCDLDQADGPQMRIQTFVRGTWEDDLLADMHDFAATAATGKALH